MIVLYDKDCGFCRWSMAWALRRDARHTLVAVPIQSQLGAELLVDVNPSERLRSAHVIADDGSRHSGGAAAADVLSALPQTRALGRLADRLPAPTGLIYDFVAGRRRAFGRFVGEQARRRADALLDASSAERAAELSARTRSAAP